MDLTQWRPKKGTKCPDFNGSEEILKMIFDATRMRGNPQVIDSLASQWDYQDIKIAVDISIALFKTHPMGWDRFLSSIEFVLDNASKETQ